MGTTKTIVANRPEEIPGLLRDVIDSLTVDNFCATHELGPGPTWDVYHTLCHRQFWSVAVRFTTGDVSAEYLFAPAPTCLIAVPQWKRQISAMARLLH